ncbi:MAG: hypothetical protein WB992_25010 [Bryobacteraceae bacterium]
MALAALICLPAWTQSSRCRPCHPNEVEGYSRYSMAHSLRKAAREPAGSFEDSAGAKFTTYSNENGTWQEAKFAFDRLLQLDPSNPVNEENAGRAELACGNPGAAISHLQKAVKMDPLLLSTIEVLEKIYRERGDTAAEAALEEQIRQAIGGTGQRGASQWQK